MVQMWSTFTVSLLGGLKRLRLKPHSAMLLAESAASPAGATPCPSSDWDRAGTLGKSIWKKMIKSRA